MKRTLQISLSCAVGLALVWLLFRGTNWSEVKASVEGVSVRWLLASQIFIWGSFFTRVQRWSYIVRVAKPVRFRIMFSATQIGFLANFTLPLRVGEFLRAFLLARLGHLSFAKSVAMVALDRVTDLVGLIAVMLVAVLSVPTTHDMVLPAQTFNTAADIRVSAQALQAAGIVTLLLLVGIIAILILLYLNQALVLRAADRTVGVVSNKMAGRIHAMLEQFAEGLHIFRSVTDMSKSIFYSLLTWACFVLATITILAAFHMECPWYTPFVIQALVAVSVSVPGAPGFVGQFHLPIVVSLLMLAPAVDVDEAKAVAIVIHLLNLGPVALAGLFCLAIEHLGILELRREAAAPEAYLDAEGKRNS
ncbi:MAG: flippase-like domain-containing protein [Candidatus Hydrogenedentes bacterium]|nr:flippase-like domain-containing protein [Candidatus Hydrogenedentota bacterium]